MIYLHREPIFRSAEIMRSSYEGLNLSTSLLYRNNQEIILMRKPARGDRPRITEYQSHHWEGIQSIVYK